MFVSQFIMIALILFLMIMDAKMHLIAITAPNILLNYLTSI
jgi:hypothetical protein